MLFVALVISVYSEASHKSVEFVILTLFFC